MPTESEVKAGAAALYSHEYAAMISAGGMPCDINATMKYLERKAMIVLEAAEKVRSRNSIR